MPSNEEIRDRIINVTTMILNIDPAQIEDTSDFSADLGAESLQSVELVAGFEEEFEIEFNNNEILGSLLLRELDFIAPETFHVVVDVNGSESLMLFQEKAEKELLERNMRREGPIFEGDEVLLWSYKNYENFLLKIFR